MRHFVFEFTLCNFFLFLLFLKYYFTPLWKPTNFTKRSSLQLVYYTMYSDLLPIRHFWWFRTFKRASLRNPWNCNLAEVHYQINVSYMSSILWNLLWNIRIRKRSGNENHLSIPLLICTWFLKIQVVKKQVWQTGFLACKIQFEID